MSLLFSPLTLGSATLRNRVVVSPMCQYSSVDGLPSTWHQVHLGSFAVGGAGLVITEAAAVSPEGRISPDDAGLWNDAQRDAWAPIVTFVQSQGALAGVQLAHAGRKASTYAPGGPLKDSVPLDAGGWRTVAPSALAFGRYAVPSALTQEGIDQVVADFAAAATRAAQAGFDVVEIHAAHGYLLHEFLSPLSNERTDDYGGSFENRTRLTREVTDAVRASFGGAVLVRLSAQDWVEGGWSLEETVTLAGQLDADLIDCSSGGLDPRQQITVGPGYQVPFAEAVRAAGVKTGAVGMITEPSQAEQVLQSGQADLVLLAREMLRDPHWALRAATALGATIAWPKQYERARP